jgi:hypothetical protein
MGNLASKKSLEERGTKESETFCPDSWFNYWRIRS